MARSSLFRLFRLSALALVSLVLFAPRAQALERICDVAFEDCRTPLIDLINNETVGIDVAFWFMEDTRYATAIINRWNAGVPVRVLVDTEANPAYPGNVTVLKMLKDAGIPMREKSGGSGILHWKLMLFAGQNTVEFSGANYSSDAFVPQTPYADYVDEVIYFTDKASYVDSFKTRYDDAWTDTAQFSNYANVSGPLVRTYPTFALDPEINWVPWQNFATRSVNAYNNEKITTNPNAGVDAIMYRITDRRHTDALIAALQRGVPVRLISEPLQYRDETRLWDSWNVDRLYMAGAQIRMRSHAGLSHEKLTLLKGQQLTIFGSSNWTGPSAQDQHEHNIFTPDSTWFLWAQDHFNRKWNNLAPGGVQETQPFVPLPPDTPTLISPANGASGFGSSATLKWYAGPWAHKYDVYLGTDPNNLTKVVIDQELGPSQASSDYKTWTATSLAGSTTYYWKITSRTMANLERSSGIFSFRTAGALPTAGTQDVVLYASRATTFGGWSVAADTSAAGGKRLSNPNLGASTISPALAQPAQYFELQFNADAGVGYRLWIRGKATGNTYENDSVWAQFSDSVNSSGSALWRIGSTAAAKIEIEDCVSCGLADWGWQDTDNSSAGSLGPLVYFQNSGTHTLRVQVREDGLSIDQIILSNSAFLSQAPGATKYDGAIYAEQGGVAGTPPPPGGALPSGWSTSDIGPVGAAGNATYNGGTFTVVGSGGDIWGTADTFRYVYQTLTGDGSITALVSSVQNTDTWSKAGVMIRSDLSAGAAHASMFVSAAKGLAFQRRTTSGGISTNTAGPSGTAPYWVRITRSGNTVTAYRSFDGNSWTPVGSDTIALPATAYVGLAVTSHNDGVLASDTFDAVAIVAASTPPPPPPPPSSLPSGWTTSDVGSPRIAGSATANNGTFTLQGSGADIWGSADAFRYVYQQLTGDGSITARVSSLTNTDAWTKGGVMIRADLSAGAAQASMFVSSAKGLAFQRRTVTGGASTHTSGGAGTAPYWVRVTRSGNSVSALVSTDGTTWLLVGTDTIALPATAYVGLALTSHTDAALATAVFDNVSITTSSTPPPPPPPAPTLPTGWSYTDVGSTGAAGSGSESNGTFTVKGAGADVWGNADAFGFASTLLTGDGTITARVATIQNVNAWTKAGVMMRDGLSAGAAHAFMLATPTTVKGTAFQRRTAAGGASTNTTGPMVAPPYWVRLTRSGSTLTASVSPDGATWTVVATDTITMGSTIDVGLAVTSHVAGTPATATFDNVSITATVP